MKEHIPSAAFQWSRDLACTLSHSTASPDDNEVDFFLGVIRLSLSDSSLVHRILTSTVTQSKLAQGLEQSHVILARGRLLERIEWAVPGLVMEAITSAVSYARHCSSMQVTGQRVFSLLGTYSQLEVL